MISGIQPGYAASSSATGHPAAVPEQTKAQEVAIPTYAPLLMRFEQQARLLVTQFRNPESGELRVQYPAEAVVQAYTERQRAEARAQGQEAPSQAPQTEQDTDAAESGLPGTDPAPMGRTDAAPAPTGDSASAPETASAPQAAPATPAAEKVNVSA